MSTHTRVTTAPVPAGWIFEPNDDDTARFVLGTMGVNPLICFGVNPSTAKPNDLDHTLRRVRGYATRNGHDSWLMLNLYAQRSTDPKGIHAAYLPELKAENERHIAELIDGRTQTLLAAWGGTIRTRPYLRTLLADIVTITDASSCSWRSIGGLTDDGHPRHPSRGAYRPLQTFDMDAYLRTL